MISEYRASILALIVSGVLAVQANAADPRKVLHIPSFDIETLDPHQAIEIPSRNITDAIFEALYNWDYLASSATLAPVTAAAPPVITDGGRTWTIRLKTGIYFTDDVAFGGKPRELVAQDYVYSLKRRLDPNLRRGGYPAMADLIIGARGVVDAAKQAGAKFDYDRPIDGLRATDRYTLQIKLSDVNYPTIREFVTVPAMAREVVEAAGGDIRARPVGTGPYRLREWRRGSKVVLEANPNYRQLRFPPSSDPAHAALEQSMRGKVLPQIGVIEIGIIEEETTRLLEFESGALDYVDLRSEAAARLLAGDGLKPEYAARGISRHVFAEPFLFSTYFNMKDSVVGGLSNERIALRRAIALGLDRRTLVDVLYAGQALPANQLAPPGLGGHDPAASNDPGYDPAAARSLLDRFGYGGLDAAGYRKTPAGEPLTIVLTLRTGTISRETETLWKKSMDAIGIRIDFRVLPFQDLVKEVISGKFQMFSGGFGGTPAAEGIFQQLDGRQPPSTNATRFDRADYNLAMDEYRHGETIPQQIVAARKMTAIARTYVPLMPTIFRLENDFVQPWVQGFSPMRFSTYWQYLDIDLAKQPKGK